jgi:hypothetical protein
MPERSTYHLSLKGGSLREDRSLNYRHACCSRASVEDEDSGELVGAGWNRTDRLLPCNDSALPLSYAPVDRCLCRISMSDRDKTWGASEFCARIADIRRKKFPFDQTSIFRPIKQQV